MTFDRRNFIKKSFSGGLIVSAPMSLNYDEKTEARYEKIDQAAAKPVLKKELFKDPVIIDRVELLHFEGNFLCQVFDKSGNQGVSISNNARMNFLYPIFIKQVAPFFIGKDARDLDNLIEGARIHASNYKYQGLALWIPVATVEFALLDLLGKMADRSMAELLGDRHHPSIAVYEANNFRGKSAEESIKLIKAHMDQTNAKALKFKIGGRMSNNADYPSDRSEKLIPLVRKTFGDDMVIYTDSNGSYDAKEAIRIGKLIEEQKFDFYEEPVPFDWYEETREVKDGLKVPIAGGEQEPSMHNFRWLIGNDALDIVQPDIFYFGGMIRGLKVARMAEALGKQCVPHISGSGLGYLYMMHFVSILSNAGPYHEFKGFSDDIPIASNTSDLKMKEGKIDVPTGPGLGVDIDPDFIRKHKKIEVI
ncbi:MAG: mandelate racemase/muconate lactonizing enzyme family protein [Cyclobacteriaceae bacterium]|nr:mandelate racemase/muconate lactonizing enzyme family protein [Cyclobacteriaceae bacterium SS2]